jgi:hypothetical protein
MALGGGSRSTVDIGLVADSVTTPLADLDGGTGPATAI